MDNLIKQTRELLNARKGEYPRVAEGAGVGLQWLYKFGQGRINNPTLKNLSALHSYLTSKSGEAA